MEEVSKAVVTSELGSIRTLIPYEAIYMKQMKLYALARISESGFMFLFLLLWHVNSVNLVF